METSTPLGTGRGRLHPLLTAAAVSVTVFSAVGVAAIAGLIPHSKGQGKEETPVAAAVEAPAVKPEALPATPAPAPKPAKKHIVRHTPPVPPAKPVETVAAAQIPPVAQ